MSSNGAVLAERPLANAGPILAVAAVGLVAVAGLVLSLIRDPGLPAAVEDSYMRVAGGLVTPSPAEKDPARLSAALSGPPLGALRVPALDAAGYVLAGGARAALGGAPAALAIYHDALRDLVVWHATTGGLEELPEAPDARTVGGRRFVLHYKAATTIVFWQEGPMLMAITSTLPAEQVMAIAIVAARHARP